MNIKIQLSTLNETKDFEDKVWASVDKKHWGRDIVWNIREYRFSAKKDDNIVGVIYGKYEAGTTYIDNLVVDEKYRRQGIGTSLVNYIERWTHEQGGHKVWLVTHINWEANQLYLKLGYKKTCLLQKHFLGEDFILYEKFLTRIETS
jgi:ribosomal protein S18 acetylase RimI-like enzyme